MRTALTMIVGFALFASACPVHADETPAKSRIVAVGLFKNGLAIVKREAILGRTGTYVLDDVPQPVHGTYWVESAVPIETAVKMREVEVPANEAVPGNLQEDLAGKQVTIHFKGDKVPPASGTVMKLKPAKGETGRAAAQATYLVLQTAKGRTYLEPAEIAYVETEGTEEKVKRRQPRLLLTVGETDKAENKVAISYLTHGLSWAPSYRIDITDPKTLMLDQQAVIKNELTDFDGAEVKLISGFPSVQFAHVTSPLSSRTSWAAFFQELSQRGWRETDQGGQNGVTGNSILAQQPAGYPASPPALGMSAIPAGEGVDLHYQSIGKRTLAEGDSLALSVAHGKASYERIVEWLVPDTRDEFGRNVGGRGGNLNGPSYSGYGYPTSVEDEDGDDSAWDALKFKNPFTFAMTTGPAMVVADGKFNGQRTSFWVNAGEETMLRINKALSVRTRSVENEEQQNAGAPVPPAGGFGPAVPGAAQRGLDRRPGVPQDHGGRRAGGQQSPAGNDPARDPAAIFRRTGESGRHAQNVAARGRGLLGEPPQRAAVDDTAQGGGGEEADVPVYGFGGHRFDCATNLTGSY